LGLYNFSVLWPVAGALSNNLPRSAARGAPLSALQVDADPLKVLSSFTAQRRAELPHNMTLSDPASQALHAKKAPELRELYLLSAGKNLPSARPLGISYASCLFNAGGAEDQVEALGVLKSLMLKEEESGAGPVYAIALARLSLMLALRGDAIEAKACAMRVRGRGGRDGTGLFFMLHYSHLIDNSSLCSSCLCLLIVSSAE
jgi:hypothetical protein